MIEDTDVFEVLTFEEECEFQEVGNDQPSSPPLPTMKDEILNQERDKTTAPFLFAPNEFEEEYHQPIRKKSLLAYAQDIERQERTQPQKEQLKEKPTFDDSKEIDQIQEKPVAQSLFHISYFCQNPASRQHKQKKQLQNVPIKSNIVIKATPPKTQNKQNKVKLIHRDSRFYWQLNYQVEVDLEAIKQVYDEMLDRECYLPVFAFDKFVEWTKAKTKNREHLAEAQKVLKTYLLSYTSFLNQHYSAQFQLILQNLSEARSLIISAPFFANKSTKDSKKYSQELCQRKFDLGSLIEGIYHIIVSSKTEILRKAVMEKIRSLVITRKQCEGLRLMEYSKNLYEKEEENWKVLAQIDFLLNLQNTENYCVKKIEGSKQRKQVQFWHRYLVSIRTRLKQAKKCQLLQLYI